MKAIGIRVIIIIDPTLDDYFIMFTAYQYHFPDPECIYNNDI